MYSEFEVSAEDLKRLIGPFQTEMRRGLAGISKLDCHASGLRGQAFWQ